MSTVKRSLLATVVVAVLLVGGTTIAVRAGAYTITVTGTADGVTEKSIGACEGGYGFDVADVVDIGMTNYRIWGSSAELEPVDDDGVYGSPTIAEIKANPDLIPWAVWDARFHDPNFRTHGVSLYDMLAALRDNGIAPVVSLVNVNNSDQPEWMQQLNPPDTAEDWNEWWEHVYAWVYWANVRNDLEIHDWQVHNEPDNSSQGWGGTLADYILFTQYTHDAIQYVYDTYLPGKTFRLYAPVSTHPNEWITESLIQNDAIIDVVDWHRYGPPADEAAMVNGWVDQYDSDGVHEELCISEWGTYRGGYETHGNAMNYAKYLMDHSLAAESYVARSQIFSMYDWSSRMTGLILADGTKTATYYAFRLMVRGLQGAKTRYAVTHDIPSNVWIYPIAAVDQGSNTMYVEVMNKSRKSHTITLDVSAHATSGTVAFREYGEGVNDVEAGTGSLNNGLVTFDVPASAIVQVILPLDGGPTPTPTPTPQPGAMHVGDIAMSYKKTGKNYAALATVTIVDAGDAAVEGATVYGTYSGATSESVSGITAADGQVTLASAKKLDGGTWTFCVDDVVKEGWTYDVEANVETCDSITAP